MNHHQQPLTKVLFLVPTLILTGLITAVPVSAQTFTLRRTFDDPTITAGDRFGGSVALDGNQVLIGASLDDTNGSNVGQAHLFDTSGNLLQTFDDPTVTDHDYFGYSVALDGNRVLIGAYRDDTKGSTVGYLACEKFAILISSYY